MGRIRVIIIVILAAAAALAAGYSSFDVRRQKAAFAEEVKLAQQDATRPIPEIVITDVLTIPRGVALAHFLRDSGVRWETVNPAVAAAQAVFNMRRVRAGEPLEISRTIAGDLRALRYQIDGDHELVIEHDKANGYAAKLNSIAYRQETVPVAGVITDSLFNAVTRAGETPMLAIELANLFAFDLDFYSDPQPGDTFRLVVEKSTAIDGRGVRYGRILAAEYRNAGKPYTAVLFRNGAESTYYAADGKALKKAFLKSPLKFAAPITSHFSRSRFHPVLKRHRAHLGTDYGAPVGTPVQTIAAGTVQYAGYKGANGNFVHIKHSNGYETMYLHLSRVLVRRGQKVQQGQIVGRVGATGLASGPHLDFRIRDRRGFLNFARLKLPPSDPVAKKHWKDFVTQRDAAMALLPNLDVVVASAKAATGEAAGQ